MAALVTRLSGDFSAYNLGLFAVDPTLAVFGANAFASWDFGGSLGWPSQADPTNGETFSSLGNGVDGTVTITAPGQITYAGGGFDFSSATAGGQYITFPGVGGALNSAGDQSWFLLYWLKFPSQANWTDDGWAGTLVNFGNFTSGADVVTLYLARAGSVYNIVAKRQRAAATTDAVIVSMTADTYSQVAQVGVWYTAGTMHMQVRVPAATITATPVAGATNTQDFSALNMIVGLSNVSAYPWTNWSHLLNARNHRLYRGIFASLYGISDTITDVLDADYTFTVNRSVFS